MVIAYLVSDSSRLWNNNLKTVNIHNYTSKIAVSTLNGVRL